MTRYVGVAKAAKMLGVSRTALQKLIRSGELTTFEGQVDLENLRQRFPALAVNESAVLERTQIIRDNAYAKRLEQALRPDKDSLMSQIRRLKVEISVYKNKEKSYRLLFEDLLKQIDELQHKEQHAHQQLLDELNHWLVDRIGSADLYLAKLKDESSNNDSSK